MKVFIASLVSTSPYSQSYNFARDVPRDEKETADAWENRAWRNRCHVHPNGQLFIPPTSFKEALTAVASYLGVQIPGKGKQTYAKHFRAGILIAEGPTLPVTRDEVEGEWLYLNADGRKGGSRRVWRCMPVIREWAADLPIHVLDETITEDVLRYHLEQAGAFIGIGRFRPQNGGWYGRFRIKELVAVG